MEFQIWKTSEWDAGWMAMVFYAVYMISLVVYWSEWGIDEVGIICEAAVLYITWYEEKVQMRFK